MDVKTISNIVSRYSSKLREEHLSSRRPIDAVTTKSWVEPDRVLEKPGHALVVILPTIGCHWALTSGGCSMCGYIYDGVCSPPPPSFLVKHFRAAYEKIATLPPPVSVKIFTSGSFFDEREVPEQVRNEIFRMVSKEDKIEEVIVETRPEFVREDAISKSVELLAGKTLTVAIGLETVNDNIRALMNKGFTLEDFSSALRTLKDLGVRVKVYLLVKPPLLREVEAVLDAEKSIVHLSKMGVDVVSLNPCTVHKGTFLELLWERGEYRPPWLWSLTKIILDVQGQTKTTIICTPTASGRPRGPHNCGVCDKQVDAALKRFSTTQDVRQLEGVDCECKLEWKLYCQDELMAH